MSLSRPKYLNSLSMMVAMSRSSSIFSTSNLQEFIPSVHGVRRIMKKEYKRVRNVSSKVREVTED